MCYRCDVCNNIVPNSTTTIVRPEVVVYSTTSCVHQRKVCLPCRDAIDTGIPIATLRHQAERAAVDAQQLVEETRQANVAATVPKGDTAAALANNLRFGLADPFAPLAAYTSPRETRRVSKAHA